jgi:hypothetical protein
VAWYRVFKSNCKNIIFRSNFFLRCNDDDDVDVSDCGGE